jgi:hypothetical protein
MDSVKFSRRAPGLVFLLFRFFSSLDNLGFLPGVAPYRNNTVTRTFSSEYKVIESRMYLEFDRTLSMKQRIKTRFTFFYLREKTWS